MKLLKLRHKNFSQLIWGSIWIVFREIYCVWAPYSLNRLSSLKLPVYPCKLTYIRYNKYWLSSKKCQGWTLTCSFLEYNKLYLSHSFVSETSLSPEFSEYDSLARTIAKQPNRKETTRYSNPKMFMKGIILRFQQVLLHVCSEGWGSCKINCHFSEI